MGLLYKPGIISLTEYCLTEDPNKMVSQPTKGTKVPTETYQSTLILPGSRPEKGHDY